MYRFDEPFFEPENAAFEKGLSAEVGKPDPRGDGLAQPLGETRRSGGNPRPPESEPPRQEEKQSNE